jgi:hypothetical protein
MTVKLGHIPHNLTVYMAYSNFHGESDRNQKLSIHELPVTFTGTSNYMNSQCSLMSCKWRQVWWRGNMQMVNTHIVNPKCNNNLIFMTFHALHSVMICWIPSTSLYRFRKYFVTLTGAFSFKVYEWETPNNDSFHFQSYHIQQPKEFRYATAKIVYFYYSVFITASYTTTFCTTADRYVGLTKINTQIN